MIFHLRYIKLRYVHFDYFNVCRYAIRSASCVGVRLFTIPLGMLRLIEIQQYAIEWGPILAGVVMVIVPIVAFYIATQRNIVEGLTSGAIKG